MERALKKRLYVYTIGMVLATVVVVSVITIYYEYRVRYMATTLYGANKEAGKQLLYILFYGRQGNTVTADYSAILQEAGYTRNGAWYMFLYGGEYIPFAVIIGIMVILLAFAIYNIVKIGHNDVYSYMNKLKEDNENISKELDTYRTYMEKRNRQLQDFTENIAHQIKTPLAAIILNLEFMQELHMDERMGRLVDESAGSAFRIRDFIRTLLNISRFENKKVIIAADEVIIGSIITDSINNCMNCIIHENQNDIFIVQYDDKCESAVIYADEMWLVEAIANVIGNSADYIKNIPDGKVYITAGCDERKVVIRIEDNGKGLTVKDQDDIFDRFSTTRNSASDMHVGLGLNLSRLIIEAHYGIIKAGNSEEYGGAEFTIILPRYRLKDKR